MSDWFITKSTLSAVAGLNMMMPGDITVNLDGLGSGGSYLPQRNWDPVPAFKQLGLLDIIHRAGEVMKFRSRLATLLKLALQPTLDMVKCQLPALPRAPKFPLPIPPISPRPCACILSLLPTATCAAKEKLLGPFD